jgi:hypothetical protein
MDRVPPCRAGVRALPAHTEAVFFSARRPTIHIVCVAAGSDARIPENSPAHPGAVG